MIGIRSYSESVVGKHTVVTRGNLTRVFLGDIKPENIVYAYRLEHVGRYSQDHGSITHNVRECPQKYTIGDREAYLRRYRNRVEFVRAGLIHDEKNARKLAVNYGFPIGDLEEALSIGEQRIIEMDKKSTGLKRWMRREKERLLTFGFASLFTIVSEVTGFSKYTFSNDLDNSKEVSILEENYDASLKQENNFYDRTGIDMVAFLFGCTTGLGISMIHDKRKRKRILEKAKER